jgi:integrase
LKPYLDRPDDAFCFSPAESEQQRQSTQRQRRKSKVQPSQLCRRVEKRKRPPQNWYDRTAYARALARGCERAFPTPKALSKTERKLWRREHHFHPNQLRHSTATVVRQQFGLEAAQSVLGHAHADVTQVYAERDLALAEKVAKMIG